MSSISFLVLAFSAPGCGGGVGETDSGPGGLDGGRDAQVLDGAVLDAGDEVDGGEDVDAGEVVDGGGDVDAGGDVDGGSDVDGGCPPPECPAPPMGCNYVGGSACSCGTLMCTAPTCARCRREEHCATPDGMCGGTGTCTATPGICPDVFMPVCGCDGMTYGNECEAHAAGQSVAFDGECPPPSDCRTEGCAPGSSCMPCRGVGGAVYVCIPDGAAC